MKRFFTLVSLLALLAGFTACNGKLSSDQEVAELKAMVLDQDGNIAFDPSTISGLYIIGVDSKEDAKDLASLYAGSGFTGKDYTRTIGDRGTVKVAGSTNGVFYTVTFRVEGIPSFTLDITDANDENRPVSPPAEGESGTYHKCGVCHKTWRSHSNVCPWTSKHKS